MPARATCPRGRGVGRIALALAGGISLAAAAQPYRIPDLRTPPPRVATAPPAGERCAACGRIASIREISTMQGIPAASLAPVPGGEPGSPNQQNLIGAVIYLPVGGQRADKPYIGGVGTPEMNARMREITYEITLRMDDGTYRTLRRPDGSSFGVGDRVRWLGASELELLVGN
jgi:hypothetical protein